LWRAVRYRVASPCLIILSLMSTARCEMNGNLTIADVWIDEMAWKRSIMITVFRWAPKLAGEQSVDRAKLARNWGLPP
jgi:hypothetical protein